MAEKATKIADIKSPEKVAPAASSRPIVVTNRPVLSNDPMMVSDQTENSKPAEITTRTAKTIKPIDDTLHASGEEAAEASEQAPAAEQPAASVEPAEAERDSEAQAASAETEAAEALAAREQELEQLIASGKYAVPIDAVQRKRSRMFVILLCLLAVVLALVLLDALLDAGIVKLPDSIPHTHFFSNS